MNNNINYKSINNNFKRFFIIILIAIVSILPQATNANTGTHPKYRACFKITGENIKEKFRLRFGQTARGEEFNQVLDENYCIDKFYEYAGRGYFWAQLYLVDDRQEILLFDKNHLWGLPRDTEKLTYHFNVMQLERDTNRKIAYANVKYIEQHTKFNKPENYENPDKKIIGENRFTMFRTCFKADADVKEYTNVTYHLQAYQMQSGERNRYFENRLPRREYECTDWALNLSLFALYGNLYVDVVEKYKLSNYRSGTDISWNTKVEFLYDIKDLVYNEHSKMFYADTIHKTQVDNYPDTFNKDVAKRIGSADYIVNVCFGPYSALLPSQQYSLHLNQKTGNNKKEILKVNAGSTELQCVKVPGKIGDIFEMSMSSDIPERRRSEQCASMDQTMLPPNLKNGSMEEITLLFAIAGWDMPDLRKDIFKSVSFYNHKYRKFKAGCEFNW